MLAAKVRVSGRGFSSRNLFLQPANKNEALANKNGYCKLSAGRAKAKRLLQLRRGARRLQAVRTLSQLQERSFQRRNQLVHVSHKPEIARTSDKK